MSSVPFFENPRNFWIRWLCVLPATILVYAITSPLVKIIFEFGPSMVYTLSDFYIKYSIPFLAGLISGWVMIAIPYIIAPYYKTIVSSVFLGITILLTILVIVIGYDSNPKYSSNTESAAHIVGAI